MAFMKTYRPVLFFIFIVLIPIVGWSDSHSEAESVDEPSGFGLQAAVFRQVRNVNTDFTKNFSSMADYTLTPGDIFKLSVTTGIRSDGSISNAQEYTIQLQKDYSLNVPFIGKINVKGRSLPELQNIIDSGIRKLIPAQYINFVLTSPAQFNVFIYGGVNLPGFIVANPLMTVIDAIGAAKGFKSTGSYRKVMLIRKDDDGIEESYELDISRFYEKAEFDSNPALQPGDTIYIPPADIVATVSGKIKFPGTYELRSDESLKELIDLAGSVVPDAQASRIEVNRIEPNGERTRHLVSIDEAHAFSMQNSDLVVIRSTAENSDMITIEGAVFGSRISGEGAVTVPTQMVRRDIPYYLGQNLLAVLDDVGGPTPFAIFPAAYVERKDSGRRIYIQVEELWETRSEAYNLELFPGDRVFIPIETLKVFVTGSVNDPNAYDYITGAVVQDYILYAGGVVDNVGDPKGLFIVDTEGRRSRVRPTDEVPPGTNIFVAKKLLQTSNQFVQNALIVTTWITAIWAVTETIFDIVDTIQARATP
jgi:protein involved in polysaccharide export with SLBB domain